METKRTTLSITHVDVYPSAGGTIMNVYEVRGDDESLEEYNNWLSTSKIKPENRYSADGTPKFFSSDCVKTGEIVFSKKRNQWMISNLVERAISQEIKKASRLGEEALANEMSKMQALERIANIRSAFRKGASSSSSAPESKEEESKVDSEENELDMP